MSDSKTQEVQDDPAVAACKDAFDFILSETEATSDQKYVLKKLLAVIKRDEAGAE